MPNLETIAKFFTVVPDPMILVDSQGIIVLANTNTYRLFGYAPDELTGKPVACLLPERFRGTHGKHLESYFHAPTVRSMGIGMELSASRSDDSEFPVEISLSPFHAADAVFALASIRDITERKHLELARRESEIHKGIAEERRHAALVLEERNASLNALFDASPIGILTTTQSGIIDRWNRTAGKFLDTKPAKSWE